MMEELNADTSGMDDVDEGDDVYGFADLLLQGCVAGSSQLLENTSSSDDEDIAEIYHDEDGASREEVNGWVNPLASLQAYSIEPQVVMNEVRQTGSGGVEYSTAPAALQGSQVIEIVPDYVSQEVGGDEQVEGSVDQVEDSNNQGESAEVELLGEVEEAIDEAEVILDPLESTEDAIESEVSVKIEGDDAVLLTDDHEVGDYDDDDGDDDDDDGSGQDEVEIQDVSKPQFNIVSLDPTSFPDAKVKEIPHSSHQQGRRSKSKQKAKPRRLMDNVSEPPIKRPRRAVREARNPREVLPRKSNRIFAKQLNKAQPEVSTSKVSTKVKKRGRPPKKHVELNSNSDDRNIKSEAEEESSDGEPVETVTVEGLHSHNYPFQKAPGPRTRGKKRNTKKLKGTHIMHYKKFFCFICNDGHQFVNQPLFVKHWSTCHFVVEKESANLYCPDCSARYSVSLSRFHRATDVLQYVAFYFNHRLKKHNMMAPDYVKQLHCSEPNCHYLAYTTYCLSRHVEEGKHRLRPLAIHRLPPPDGSGRREQLGEMYKIPGNKYTLIFKRYICYVCKDGVVFDSANSLLDHWRQNHFEFTDQEAVIACSFCSAKYRVPKKRFHRQTDTMQYIAYYFSHLVKRHNLVVPDYIAQLSCCQPGCKFITYTKQLLERHLQEVKHITLSRTPSLTEGEPQLTNQSSRSPYLNFKEYRCFRCRGDDGEHLGPFENGATLAEHWRSSHFSVEENRLVLKCDTCSIIYTIHASRYSRNGDVLAMIARFFTHQVKKHGFAAPAYIEELVCKVPGCEYKCFTAQIMDGHRNNKREPAHMGMTSTDTTAGLSIRGPKSASISRDGDQHDVNDSVPSGSDAVPEVNTDAHMDPSNAIDNSGIDSEAVTLSTEITEGVLNNICLEEAVDASDGFESSLGNLDQSRIDIGDSKAKSLLNFTEIKCFLCNDDLVYENHNKYVTHWRSKHFTIGEYEVYIDCPKCHSHIGLNKPLWHRDHDIGRCVASFLTHLIKSHATTVPHYIKELACPEPGCHYKTLTVKHFQFHVRHTKHHKLERAKRLAAGGEAGTLVTDHYRKGYPFRMTENGLSFKEFQCYICQDGVIFQTTLEYEDHWRKCHVMMKNGKKDTISCHLCGTSFASQLYPSIAFLFCHLVKKHEIVAPWYIEEFKCDVAQCNYVTFTRALFEKHKAGQRHISGSGVFQYYLNFLEYRCFLCPSPAERFSSKRVFEQHMLDEHVLKSSEGDYMECINCKHRFVLHYCKKPEMNYEKADPSRTLCVLFNHMVVKHKHEVPPYIKAFNCSHEGCNFVSVRKYTLSRHELSHVPDQQCYQCGMFFSKTRIDKHTRKCLRGESDPSVAAANPKSYPCSECGVTMIQRKMLRRHMMEAHSMSKEEASSVIKEASPPMKNSKQRASESGMAYRCNDCHKVLLEKKSMKRHIQSAHGRIVENNDLECIPYDYKAPEGPKNYECIFCGVQMNLMKSVKRHMMKQHGTKVGAHDLETYVRGVEVAPGESLTMRPPDNEEELMQGLIVQDADIGGIHEEFDVDVQQARYTESPALNIQPHFPERQVHQGLVQQVSIVSQPPVLPMQVALSSSSQQQQQQQHHHHHTIFTMPKAMMGPGIIHNNQALDYSMRFSELEAGEIPTNSVITHNQRVDILTNRLGSSHTDNTHPGLLNDALSSRLPHELQSMAPDRMDLVSPRFALVPPTSVPSATVIQREGSLTQMLPMDYRVPPVMNELLHQRMTSWPHPNQQ